jgi:3-deoxy-D-manno-octulosonic-acid transferase
VSLQLEQDNKLDFIEDFLQGSACIVCGSTWPEGEKHLFSAINNKAIKLKYVIAPHQINDTHINEIAGRIEKPCIKYSDIDNQTPGDYDVLILNTIGLLTKVYAYADLAYVGGGFGHSGLHNILEPAAFGVPVLIGPNHQKFPEAEDLQNHGGLLVVRSADEMQKTIISLVENNTLRNKMSLASKTFIQSQKGATAITVKGIVENKSL